MKTTPYPLRMSDELMGRIDVIAEKRQLPRATMARSLIAERLNQIEKEEENEK